MGTMRSHSQIPTQSKVGPEKSVEWEKQGYSTYTLPVIRYPACIIRWPKEEIEATDIKTRKLPIMHGGFHPKSSTLRLYTKG